MGWIKRFFCHMGWHSYFSGYEDIPKRSNAVNAHARCPWCGFEGMVDSQGNLF